MGRGSGEGFESERGLGGKSRDTRSMSHDRAAAGFEGIAQAVESGRGLSGLTLCVWRWREERPCSIVDYVTQTEWP